VLRRTLLKASENAWLRKNATSSRLLRRSVRRFLPGESLEHAVGACSDLAKSGVGTVLTHLGENVAEKKEAAGETNHYLNVLHCIGSRGLPVEISVKLTQLGLDLDPEFCLTNLTMLTQYAPRQGTTWIDMWGDMVAVWALPRHSGRGGALSKWFYWLLKRRDCARETARWLAAPRASA